MNPKHRPRRQPRGRCRVYEELRIIALLSRSWGLVVVLGSFVDTVLAVSQEVQTCYRHGDRRAGVRCQRCGRAICPACMTQASVGFHCPECVKGASQKVITARTMMAGATPYVTYTLMAINVVVYVFSISSPDATMQRPSAAFLADWAVWGEGAVREGFGIATVGVANGEWYRLITGGFLHANLLHIGFNMFVLFILGRQLEPAIGRSRFIVMYFASLLAGSLGVMLLDPTRMTVGASGAVFGLFGYALVAQYARGINPMDTGIGGIVILNLLITFTLPGISVGGHLGGLIGGALLAAMSDVVGPRLRMPDAATIGAMAGLGGVFALTSIAVV